MNNKLIETIKFLLKQQKTRDQYFTLRRFNIVTNLNCTKKEMENLLDKAIKNKCVWATTIYECEKDLFYIAY